MPTDTSNAPDNATYLLESEQPISGSLLWKAQRVFYHRNGVNAWRSPVVPHYVTGNPALAKAYAATVLGFFRDCHVDGAAGPFTILEVGAGSGRFGYLFVRALLELWRLSPLSDTPFRYVMTDFTETNVAFWRDHRAFAAFVEQGLLDFGVFDAEHDTEVHALRTDRVLTPGGSCGPLVVIANYVFDSIPQDVFVLRDGRIHENLISVLAPWPEIDMDSVAPFENLVIRHSQRLADPDYYQEPQFNQVLRQYAEELPNAAIAFPCTALRCTERLANLSDGRFLLLSGDRDGKEETFLRPPEEDFMAVHGSFSMFVNHDAIARWVKNRGGRVLQTSYRHAFLNVVAFLLGAPPGGYRDTELSFEQSVESAGPDDFFNLRRGVQNHYHALEPAQILSLLRLSHYDPRVLRDCAPALTVRIAEAHASEKTEIVKTVLRSWENYFPIGEDPDLSSDVAKILYAAGAPAEASRILTESRRIDAAASTHWNLGLCYLAQGDTETAVRCFSAATAQDPGLLPQGAWL